PRSPTRRTRPRALTLTTRPPHTYPTRRSSDLDVYPVSVTVTDDDTGTESGSTAVTVNNVAPSALVLNSGTINENDTFALAGTFLDRKSTRMNSIHVKMS